MLDVVERDPVRVVEPPGLEFSIVPPGRTVSVNWPELWRYRDLFVVMAWRDISIRYKQTVLGILWALIQPTVNIIVFTVVFGQMAGVKVDGPYPIFVCVGQLLWGYYSTTLQNASNSMVTNAAIIQKVYFPRLILPATAATTGLVDLGISSVILVGMMTYYHSLPSLLGIVLLPIMLVILILASLGGGLFLAAVNVRYRDVRYALPFLIQVLMYATPVMYPPHLLEKYVLLKVLVLWLNPVSGVITTARATLIHNGVFEPRDLLISFVMSMIYFVIGLYYFRTTERYFADIA